MASQPRRNQWRDLGLDACLHPSVKKSRAIIQVTQAMCLLHQFPLKTENKSRWEQNTVLCPRQVHQAFSQYTSWMMESGETVFHCSHYDWWWQAPSTHAREKAGVCFSSSRPFRHLTVLPQQRRLAWLQLKVRVTSLPNYTELLGNLSGSQSMAFHTL